MYDEKTHRYDHHQREFTEVFGHGHAVTKLSSAGLVYKHFGREVLANILKDSALSPADLEVGACYHTCIHTCREGRSTGSCCRLIIIILLLLP